MLWKAGQALDERTEYTQLSNGRWKATYRGFISVSSEGNSPKESQYNLTNAFDVRLATLVKTSYPSKPAASKETAPKSAPAEMAGAPGRPQKTRPPAGTKAVQKRQRRR